MRSSSRLLTGLALLALGLPCAASCKGDGTLSALSYDQSCNTNADCVTVAVGIPEDACCSHCEAAAISTSAKGKYDKDRSSFCAALTGKCPVALMCPLAPAICAGGTCSTNPPCDTLVCPDSGLFDASATESGEGG